MQIVLAVFAGEELTAIAGLDRLGSNTDSGYYDL